MTDTTHYNGWRNYPTWAVALWIGNDQGMYEDVSFMASSRWAAPQAESRLAEDIKEYIESELPEIPASFVSDLINYSLDQVDWNHIAATWLEDVNQ